ncbi:MAG: hypothetical protein ACKVU2_06505, partial [Saprospiraceae bacterium]
CDLLGSVAGNGQPNPARPTAMLAMVVLGTALAFFWYRLAGFLTGSRSRRVAVRISGIVSMTTACLLFTPWHDTALVISGSTVLVTLAATLVFLRQNRQNHLLRLGFVCLLFFVANNAIYWTKTGLVWLPFLQKVTICVFLYWITRISLLLKR